MAEEMERSSVGGTLPRTWYPRSARLVVAAVGVALIAATVALWWAFPARIRANFGWLQTATLLIVLVAILVVLYGLLRTRVRADAGGLLIVNVFRTHRVPWAAVVGVYFGHSDPWVTLDVDDGTSVAVMGIQSADGTRGLAAARELDTLVRVRSGAEPDA